MNRCPRCDATLPSGEPTCPVCGGTVIPGPFGIGAGPIFAPGSILEGGRFTVERLVGVGASGAVYAVWDALVGEERALKVAWQRASPEDPTMERARREVKAAQAARHPAVLAIHDLILLEGKPALVMEFVDGETLRQRIVRGGPLAADAAVTLLRPVLEGLGALHRLDIVHRDVKSANILLGKDGSVKLGDFGLARGEDLGATMTEVGQALGTPGYMAPEILRGQGASAASDLYAAGVVLFEMLAGCRPFEGSSAVEIVGRILTQAPALVTLKEKGTPSWLVRVVGRLLAKDPEDRHESAEAVLSALDSRSTGFFLPRRWKWRGVGAAVFTVLVGAMAGGASWVVGGGARVVRVAVSGKAVRGVTASGRTVWVRAFPARVKEVLEWDARPGARARFLVLYGGMSDKVRMPDGNPFAEALTASGETLARHDLGTAYNPDAGSFPTDQFWTEVRAKADFDRDGATDILLLLTHNMYPTILYALSGKDGGMMGAFANSGHIERLRIVRRFPERQDAGAAICLGINNRMAHQTVIFEANLSGMSCSPDNRGRNFPYANFYRPLGLTPLLETLRLEDAEGDHIRILGLGEPLGVDPLGALSTDPWYGDSAKTREESMRVRQLYMQVRQAREKAGAGDAPGSLDLFQGAMDAAPDEPLRLFVRADGVRTLREAGRSDLSLGLLARGRGIGRLPGTLLLQKADCLLLAGRFEEARRTYSEARFDPEVDKWYGFPGFVASSVLMGCSQGELAAAVLRDYPDYVEEPAMRGWLLLPGLLSGEAGRALEMPAVAAAAFRGRKVPSSVTANLLFPSVEEIWVSAAELEAGRKLTTWPDEREVAAQNDASVARQFRYLAATRSWKAARTPEALGALGSSFRELEAASSRDAESVVPFALCAFTYGFAAWDAGDEGDARAALKEALRLYRWGKNAERARTLLDK